MKKADDASGDAQSGFVEGPRLAPKTSGAAKSHALVDGMRHHFAQAAVICAWKWKVHDSAKCGVAEHGSERWSLGTQVKRL